MGIKKRMVIACLGEEIAKVVDPVKKYSADIVIGLHDCFRNKETYPIRSIIMGKSQEELEKYNPNMLTIYLEHDLNNFVEISNFLESVANFTCSRLKCDVFINISTGTNVFASAATMISMIHPNMHIFTVDCLESNIDPEKLKTILFNENNPTGLAISVSEPSLVNTYESNPPEKYLVLGLRILKEHMLKDPYPPSKEIISELREKQIWLREKPSPSDGVFYLRDFVDKWVENGWVEKGQLRNRYSITEKGEMILNIFYTDPDFSI